jgi:hypothetical protein
MDEEYEYRTSVLIITDQGQSVHPASSRSFLSALGLLFGIKAKAVGIPSLCTISVMSPFDSYSRLLNPHVIR